MAQLSLGATKEALSQASEAVDLLRDAGDRDGEASAALALAAARVADAQPAAALESAAAALELFRQLGDRQMEASALATSANARLALNEARNSCDPDYLKTV